MDKEEKKDKIFMPRTYNAIRFVRPGAAMQLIQPARQVQSNFQGLIRSKAPFAVVRHARASSSDELFAQSTPKESPVIDVNGSISKTKTSTQISYVEIPKVSKAVGNNLNSQPFIIQRSASKRILPKPGFFKTAPSKHATSLMIADARSLINQSDSEKGDDNVAGNNIFAESESSEGSVSPNPAVSYESILPKFLLREKSTHPPPLPAVSRMANEVILSKDIVSKKNPVILQRSPLRRESRILKKGPLPSTSQKPKINIPEDNAALKVQSVARVFEGLNTTKAGNESKDTLVTAVYSETDSISVSSDSQSAKLAECSSFCRHSTSSKEEDIEAEKNSQEVVGELEDKNTHEDLSTEAIIGISSNTLQEEWHFEKEDSPASRTKHRYVMDKATMKQAKVVVVPATHKNVTKPVSLLKMSPYRNLVGLEEVSTQSEEEEEVTRSRRTFSPRKQRLKALLKDDQAVLSIKIRNPEGITTEISQENRKSMQVDQQLQEDIGQAIDQALANMSSNQGSPVGIKKPRRRSKNQKALFQGKDSNQKEMPTNLADRILSRKQTVQNKDRTKLDHEMPQLKQYKRRRNSSDSLEGIIKIQKLEELTEDFQEIVPTPDLEDSLVSTEDEEFVDLNLKLIQISRKHNRSFLKNHLGFYEVDFNACPRAFKQLKDNGIGVCSVCKNYFSIDESPMSQQCCNCVSSGNRQKQLDLKASATSVTSVAGDPAVRHNAHINICKPIPCIHFSSSDGDFSWPLYFASDDDWKSSEPILNTRPCGISGFSVGQKLEAIDPDHPTLFCVVTIAEVKGRRLRLTFDGYDRKFDFWILDTSPDIFPAEWCSKNERRLQPPPNNITEFTWEKYLKTTKSEAAPSNLFTIPNQKSQLNRQVKKGMKLEALDMNYDRTPCVATIADVIGTRILVHFDSWDQKYDYWTDIQSPRIFPVGYARENNLRLTTPKGIADFSWETYLNETKSEAVPSPLLLKFQRPSIPWKVGMKVEAVDLRNPGFVRVATVTETEKNSLKIHYDGWPSHFSVIADEDSSDLFQPGWCNSSRCQLLPPLAVEDLRERNSGCPTPGCIGLGSARKSGAPFHYTLLDCPYSDENLMSEDFPERVPNLLPAIADALSSIESFRQDTEEPAVELPLAPPSLVVSREEEKQATLNAIENPCLEPYLNLKLSGWQKLNKTLLSNWPPRLKVSQISGFSPEEVGQLVQDVTGMREVAQKIVEQEIKGSALVSLLQTDLREFTDLMALTGIKKGPATKLYRMINFLR